MRSADSHFRLGDIFHGLLGSGADALDGRGRNSHSLYYLPARLSVFKERVGFQ
jgi:hypothetical protein